MRLSHFILANLEAIVQEWEEFASSLVPDSVKEDHTMLRDHAKKMLQAIAADLDQPQTAKKKDDKSKGHDYAFATEETAADAHGVQRLAAGFSLNAALAEYRALRASVIRRWQDALVDTPLPSSAIEEVIRFNEAIDQAISESVTSYSFEKDQQTRVFETILSSSPDLSFTLNLNGKFEYANKALTKLLELQTEKIRGSDCSEFDLPRRSELLHQIQRVIATKEQFRGEVSFTSPSGQWAFYDYIFVPVLNKDGAVEAVAGTARDITERKVVEDKNWQKANYDVVTELPNRRLFYDRLEQEINHCARAGGAMALLFIDLDHFKTANDDFGHDAGDVLLRLAANRIRSCARKTDTVARFGGDEFTVILKDIKRTEDVAVVADNILKELASPFAIFTHTAHISASIGIALSPQDAQTAESLVKCADQAMYAAKTAGSDRYGFFSSDLQAGNRMDQKAAPTRIGRGTRLNVL